MHHGEGGWWRRLRATEGWDSDLRYESMELCVCVSFLLPCIYKLLNGTEWTDKQWWWEDFSMSGSGFNMGILSVLRRPFDLKWCMWSLSGRNDEASWHLVMDSSQMAPYSLHTNHGTLPIRLWSKVVHYIGTSGIWPWFQIRASYLCLHNISAVDSSNRSIRVQSESENIIQAHFS